jgi:plasmid maintenance system antidote protein VapI
MDQLISRQFRVALNHLLQEEGRGAQTRLATAKDIDRGYLNSIVRGRQAGSDETRARIADHFETTFEDMLAFGRQILVEKGELAPRELSRIGRKTGSLFPGAIKSQGKSLPTNDSRITDEIIAQVMLKTLEVLREASFFSDTLIGSIDVFYEAVITNTQNLVLSNQMVAIESRVANIEMVLSDTKTAPLKLRKAFVRSVEEK